MAKVYGKNRIDALSFFTPEEQEIILRYKAKSKELAKDRTRWLSNARSHEKLARLFENYKTAVKLGLFEAAGITLKPGTYKSYYEKAKAGDELLKAYRESNPSPPLVSSRMAQLSQSPPLAIDDQTLGEPVSS